MSKIKLRVLHMECPNCAMSLESLEDSLPGVSWIHASYRKANMEVEFDENLITLEAIIAAVKQLGYDAVPE